MKTKIFYLIPICFLLVPIINAHDFDFTNLYDITGISTTQVKSRISAYEFNDTDWYVSYQLGDGSSLNNYKFEKVDTQTYTNIETFTWGCGGGTKGCEYSFCNYIDSIKGNERYSCIGSTPQDPTNYKASIGEFYFNNETSYTLTSQQKASLQYKPELIGIAHNSQLKIWNDKVSTGDPRYSLNDVIGVTFGGDGSFNLPTIYEDPDDIQVEQCGGAYHVVVKKGNTIVDLLYNFNLEYQNKLYLFSYPNFHSSDFNYGLLVETTDQDQFLYFTQTNNTKIVFQKWSCEDNYELSPVFEKVYDTIDIIDCDVENIHTITYRDISDTGVRSADPATNYGSATSMSLRDNVDPTKQRRDYVKFDISSLQCSPRSAQMCVYLYADDANTHTASSYHVYTQDWNENTTVWNNQPCGTGFANSTYCNLTASDTKAITGVGWKCFDVTNAVQYEYYKDHNNVTIALKTPETGAGNVDEFYTKEFGTSSLRPYLNITSVDCQEQIRKPFLAQNEYGTFHLFYESWNGTHSNVKVAVDYTDCSCESDQDDWIASKNCSGKFEKHTRTCNPYGCSDNTTYWSETEYCISKYNDEYNRTQEYELYVTDDVCISEWEITPTNIICEHRPIEIPNGCIDINMSLSATPEFETFNPLIKFTDCTRGTWSLATCLPSYECTSNDYLCNDVNITKTTTKTDFDQGELVNGRSIITVGDNCKCNNFFGYYGIKSVRLSSYLHLECTVPCEQKWICLDTDTEALKQIDCGLTNVTTCEFGCNEENGRCFGSAEETGEESPTSVDFWFNLLTNPQTPTTKFVISIFGCMFIASFGMYFGGDTEKKVPYVLLFFAIGWALFTIMTWIPPILTIIIVFFLGGYFLLSRFRGN